MKHTRLLIAAALLSACAGTGMRYSADALAGAEQHIQAGDLMAYVEVLSSDKFEGRAPGSDGERLTVEYLAGVFKALGLAPGNPDGTWYQEVPLVGVSGTSTARLVAGGKGMHMNFPSDYVAVSRRFEDKVRVRDSDLVFVGYGVVAPEYGWDDYKGLDVRGKTLVMLVNDPQVPDPQDSSQLDPSLFNGRAMTYYGRWTYKYEIASELGAAAALIIHETGPAGYPWEVVSNSWGNEEFHIDRADGYKNRVAVEGWITEERARMLFKLSGLKFEDMKAAAARRDFRPVPLPATLNATVRNQLRHVKSNNVVARLEGSDPKLKDEYVVYTAHWDHLGRDPKLEGDQIYNGARDNATGTAGLLELADAFAALPTRPRRSILFLAVTAEEQGLLGAQWYGQNPLYPLDRTLANINMDGLNPWGRTSDMVVIGVGQSTLEDVLADVVRPRGRVLVPDPDSEKGYYYRSDHFEFAKVGVPALYAKAGTAYRGKPPEYGRQKLDEYTARDYHKVSDEIKPDWDLSGAADDLRVLFGVGVRVAEGDPWPQWKAGSEFKARREAMVPPPAAAP